ncbi:MAG: hypothetical protein ACRD0B_05145 [Acidimicrobiales bacterium]
MRLSRAVEALIEDLQSAAALGDESVQRAAELLAMALAPSLKLRFLELLEQAADDLAGSVSGATAEVRLEAGEPVLALRFDAAAGAAPGEPELGDLPGAVGAWRADSDSETARITLRMPEQIKAEVERAASEFGRSVNFWLVEAALRALHVPSSAGAPGGSPEGWPASTLGGATGRRGPRRVTGFVRG